MAHGRARKRFGQHFLHDPAVIARIVAAIDLKPGDAAVEIGPGQGALTQRLLDAAGQLEVVEIDRDLAALLRHRYADQPRFVLHEADALQVDWRAMAAARGARLRLIGNLPYNISTPLMFRVLEAADAIVDMHFMLQREVVDRIVAAPATAAYGRLTVMLAPRVTGQVRYTDDIHLPRMLWGRLLRDYTAAQVVPFALLVPFVGSAASSIVFGEKFGTLRLAGMITVIGGIAIMLLSKRPQSVPEVAGA